MSNIYKYLFYILGFAYVTFSSSCSDGMKKELGFGKKSPDEFQVLSNKPLSMPPNYDLVPPSDDDLANTISESDVTEKKDFDDKLLTEGDKSILKLSNADKANPRIREDLDEEESLLLVKKSLLDKILEGEQLLGTPAESLDIVDAQKERERITKKKQKREVIGGADVPTITREK